MENELNNYKYNKIVLIVQISLFSNVKSITINVSMNNF